MEFKFIIMSLLISLFIPSGVNRLVAQDSTTYNITGTIVDASDNQPLPGANVILYSDPLTGTSTDQEGNFRIKVKTANHDSLICSFVGFKEKTIALDQLPEQKIIRLNPKTEKISEAVITGKRIIAEEFTIKKMKQMDIYLNPTAKADPVLAVNSMPSSTTTDESANISLRGSSPVETGIFFNEVPVYDAVRFAQLNGIGTFSIFNTAIIERILVFPSNPPLEYGNASSGLIALQSKNKVPEHNQNNISLSLANIGGQISRKLSPETGLNVFANYQPSAGLIGVNEQSLNNLESFFSSDLGMHAIHKINDNSRIKIFNYTNLEGYEYNYDHASFEGLFNQTKKRNFTIMNYSNELLSGILSANSGLSFSREKYDFGNTDITMNKNDLHININYRHFFGDLSLNTGFAVDSRSHKLKGTVPEYDYALGPEHPKFNISESRQFNLPEIFFYGKYKLNKKWIAGMGIRQNYHAKNQKKYLSGQMNIRYNLRDNHSVNASVGRYHRFSLPNAEIRSIILYQSDQLSLDYQFSISDVEFTSALFKKNTKFGNIQEEITGAEFFTKFNLLRNKVQFRGSYTFINAERSEGNQIFPTKYDLNYFIRGSLEYKAPFNLTASLIMLYREGSYYRPIRDSHYNNTLNVYNPVYNNKSDKSRYPDYLKTDLSLSKLWPISGEISMVAFINISNVFNHNNIREKSYNYDYTLSSNLYYSKRTIYFGGIVYF